MDSLEKEAKFGSWQYNVIDEFKPLTKEQIKEKVQERSLNFAVLMTQLERDFNIGSVIRSANFLGARNIFYYGPSKKIDRRGSTGCYHYSSLQYLSSLEEILSLKESFSFVGLENNLNFKPVDIRNFNWNTGSKIPLIIVGEEGNGLSEEILNLCDYTIEIVGRGSIRSLNAAVAASIAMHDLISKCYK